MTQKTISLPEPVYENLRKQKKKTETFSDLITRLLKENKEKDIRPDISFYYGKLEEEEDGEWDKIEADIYKDRLRPPIREKLSLDD